METARISTFTRAVPGSQNLYSLGLDIKGADTVARLLEVAQGGVVPLAKEEVPYNAPYLSTAPAPPIAYNSSLFYSPTYKGLL